MDQATGVEAMLIRTTRLAEGRCGRCGSFDGPDHLCPDRIPTRARLSALPARERHLRHHAEFGDDPSGFCGCAGCDPRPGECGCISCVDVALNPDGV